MIGDVGVAVVDRGGRGGRILARVTATLERHHRDGDDDGQARPDQDVHRVPDLLKVTFARTESSRELEKEILCSLVRFLWKHISSTEFGALRMPASSPKSASPPPGSRKRLRPQ